LARLIQADIAAYLADIDTNATTPAAQLAGNQLRAAVWFGLDGFANAEDEAASLDNPDWNPLAWAWEQTAEHIARHVAHVAAEGIAQLYNGDRDTDADTDNAAALVAMFEIPLDTIAARATEELYKATRAEQDAASLDAAEDSGQGDDPAEDMTGAAAEYFPEPVAPIVAADMDELTDPNDFIPIEDIPYLHALADAQ
jgi:hypothetical protein